MYTTTSLCVSVVFNIVQQISCIPTQKLSEDTTLNSASLAAKYGHPSTQYDVVTEDGYILTLYRLPGQGSIPVLLVHGILDSSDSWMLRGARSLAITLANAGYDVWLANTRGNRYSRRHKTLDPDSDPAFWRFSFHEMGYYDLPAVIDTILNETGANKLSAVGHSQGNTIFYVLGSERREYNSKINVLIALAPIAYLHHTVAPVSTLMQLSPIIGPLASNLGVHEILGDNTTSGDLLRAVCLTPDVGYRVCVDGLFFSVLGSDREEFEPAFARTVLERFPAGSSTRSVLHFLQIGYRKIFARYDYGCEVNRRIYKSPKPPKYRLDKVNMPIALVVGRNDRLSTIPNVAALRRRLSNVVYYLEIPRPLLNHVDFIMGRNMSVYLFPYVFRILRENNHF